MKIADFLGRELKTPLWKMRVTAEEFSELRSVLHRCAVKNGGEDTFARNKQLCALYFAEWYRRECEQRQGNYSYKNVYRSLGDNLLDLSNDFYEIAKEGFESLNLSWIQNEERTRREYLLTLLYQGGVPLNRELGKEYSLLLSGLLRRNVDFENLPLGETASRSDSVREFCNELRYAVFENKRENMPVECSEEEFARLCEFKNRARRAERDENPFPYDFVCKLDHNAQTVDVQLRFNPADRIGSEYIQTNFNGEREFNLTLQIGSGRKSVCYVPDRNNDTFSVPDTQIRQYHHYSSESSYDNGEWEVLAVSLKKENETTLWSDDYDLNIPHIFRESHNRANEYVLADTLGRNSRYRRLILAPSDWTLQAEENSGIVCRNYRVKGKDVRLNVYIVLRGYEGKLILSKENYAKMDFSPNAGIAWMEMARGAENGVCPLNVVKDIRNFRFFVNTDGKRRDVGSDRLYYYHKCSRKWQPIDEPLPFGKIQVTTKESIDAGAMATPVSFCYVGDFSMDKTNQTEESANLSFSWQNGNCSVDGGVLIDREHNTWRVTKGGREFPYDIPITFSVGGESFRVNLPSPFRGCYLMCGDRRIEEDAIIPYTDLFNMSLKIEGELSYRLSIGGYPSYWKISKNSIRRYVDNVAQEEGVGFAVNDNFLSVLLGRLPVNDRTNMSNYVRQKAKENGVTISFDGVTLTVKEYPYEFLLERNILIVADERTVRYGHSVCYVEMFGENWADKLERITRGGIIFPELERGGDGYAYPYNENRSPILLLSSKPGQVIPKVVYGDNWTHSLVGINPQTEDDWTKLLFWFEFVSHYDIPANYVCFFGAVLNDIKTLLLLAVKAYRNRLQVLGEDFSASSFCEALGKFIACAEIDHIKLATGDIRTILYNEFDDYSDFIEFWNTNRQTIMQYEV